MPSGIGLRSIRIRVLAVFVLSLAALSGALGYGLVQLRDIGEKLEAVDAGYLPLNAVANELEAVARLMDREHDRIARGDAGPLAGHQAKNALYNRALSDAIERGRVTAERAHQRVEGTEDQLAFEAALSVMGEIDQLRDDYVRAFDEWASAVEAGRARTTDSGQALAELDSRRTALVLNVGLLGDLVKGRIEIVAAQASRAQTRALAVGGALSAVAITLAGLLAAVALFTLRPIALLTTEVQRVGAGDYAGRVDVRSGDEVGVLARKFNAMADAVAERDRRLKERAEALDRLSARLRQVLDTIHAGLVVVEEGRAGMCNPAAERLWGVREGEALPPYVAALAPGRYEAQPLGERQLDVDVVPFGEQGALVVGEDVTERLRDRERLARSERLALVGQMLAQITHEVRNPLNAISLNAELLADDLVEPDQKAMIATITGEIHRLEQLTARYLELSRGRRPELTPCEPARLVREVLRVEEPALRRAGVAASVDGEDAGVVDIDADALRRALRNVVRNAVEAGATRLAVRVEQRDGLVRVAVADDGPGLDPAEAARVFEPFYTTKARGTGLGLAISRQELEDVGGTIRCAGQPGQGSTFTLEVPVAGN